MTAKSSRRRRGSPALQAGGPKKPKTMDVEITVDFGPHISLHVRGTLPKLASVEKVSRDLSAAIVSLLQEAGLE